MLHLLIIVSHGKTTHSDAPASPPSPQKPLQAPESSRNAPQRHIRTTCSAHIRFLLPALTRQAEPLHAHKRIVNASEVGMLEEEAALVWSWRKAEVCGSFDGFSG